MSVIIEYTDMTETTLIVLPTTLSMRTILEISPKEVYFIEDPFYFSPRRHINKLIMYRSAMMSLYRDLAVKIPGTHYIPAKGADSTIEMLKGRAAKPILIDPIDREMRGKYYFCEIVDNPTFFLGHSAAKSRYSSKKRTQKPVRIKREAFVKFLNKHYVSPEWGPAIRTDPSPHKWPIDLEAYKYISENILGSDAEDSPGEGPIPPGYNQLIREISSDSADWSGYFLPALELGLISVWDLLRIIKNTGATSLWEKVIDREFARVIYVGFSQELAVNSLGFSSGLSPAISAKLPQIADGVANDSVRRIAGILLDIAEVSPADHVKWVKENCPIGRPDWLIEVETSLYFSEYNVNEFAVCLGTPRLPADFTPEYGKFVEKYMDSLENRYCSIMAKRKYRVAIGKKKKIKLIE